MHKISKVIFASLMVSAIVGTSAISAFAANTVIPSGNNWINSDYVAANQEQGVVEDLGTARLTNHAITVTDVSDMSTNLTVTAYQIVKGTYKDGKLTGYVLCDATNATIADMEAPTVSEITTIANNIRANTTTLQGIRMTRGTGAQANQYTATVEAGLYVVLASGSDGYVYNPAIVAVNIEDANEIADSAQDGTVDMSSYWNIPTNAYLKSSTSGFNKDIYLFYGNGRRTEGDTSAIGDEVAFMLDEMIIPDYTDEYAKPNGQNENGVIYKIDDKLDSISFAGIDRFRVMVYPHRKETGPTVLTGGNPVIGGDHSTGSGGPMLGIPDHNNTGYLFDLQPIDDNDTPLDESDDKVNYTIIYKNAAGQTITDDIDKFAVQYELKFSDEFLREHPYYNVEIMYTTHLIESAYENGAANKTVASLSYTVNPDDNTGVEVLRDSTYHYTFEIGGQIDATADGQNAGTVDGGSTFHGYELNKVTEALGANETYTADQTTGEFSSEYALAGATFTLYDDAAFTTIHQNKVRNATTSAWETEDAVYTTQADGHLVFTGLDVGTYYLKETSAPDGYTINDNDYKVVIAGTIADGTAAEEGTLTGYSITTYVKNDDNWVQCGSANYSFNSTVTKPTTDVNVMNFDTVVNTTTTNIIPAEVVDTSLATLPSTGGVGTVALTLVSATGMGAFFILYMINKKKKKNSEK